MSIANLPKGGVNRGIIIPLFIPCPSQCVCQSSEPIVWYCLCGSAMYLSEYGDIFCQNHLKYCSGNFIKNKFFQCDKAKQSNTRYQFKSISQILLSLSQCLSVLEDTIDHQQQRFCQSFLENVCKRWHS
ncbi:unnamed protein product [Paramecium octaurelia]|uniref:Uncharacterized protein n=1 Tax=Paramecium octaurelia TaxID=43137 RepID=A0A8S1X4W8_PAROT|nr:unnamed protein product [Paramecium octaurelia]